MVKFYNKTEDLTKKNTEVQEFRRKEEF